MRFWLLCQLHNSHLRGLLRSSPVHVLLPDQPRDLQSVHARVLPHHRGQVLGLPLLLRHLLQRHLLHQRIQQHWQHCGNQERDLLPGGLRPGLHDMPGSQPRILLGLSPRLRDGPLNRRHRVPLRPLLDQLQDLCRLIQHHRLHLMFLGLLPVDQQHLRHL